MTYPTKLLLLKIDDENLTEMEDFLKFYIGNSVVIKERDDIHYVFIDNMSELGLGEALASFSTDSLINFSLFESRKISNEKEYIRTLDFISLFKSKFVKKIFYKEKDLLRESLINNSNTKLVQMLAFKKYFNDSDMLAVCRAMFKYNLNISKAAEYLYIHRNTLKYKLDRFYKETEFDLRNFEDAVVLDLVLMKLKN